MNLKIDASETVLLIPTYCPPEDFPAFHIALKARINFRKIIIINDGSPSDYDHILGMVEADNTVVLHLPFNRGKGEALKKGFAYIHAELPTCMSIVTCDDDGQHTVEDIAKIVVSGTSHAHQATIIGCRDFKGAVPLKSLIGNLFMRLVLRLLSGLKVADTQSGLRFYPRQVINQLKDIKGERFSYETLCLLHLQHHQLLIIEIPIQTIYLNQNQGTRFRAIRDSIEIIGSLLKTGG